MRDVKFIYFSCSECGEDVEIIVESENLLRDDLCHGCVIDRRVERAMELMRRVGVFE